MLQKTLLILGFILLLSWIYCDLIMKDRIENLTDKKYQYLRTLYPMDEAEVYYSRYLDNLNMRPSYKKKYPKYYDLDPYEITFKDSIVWPSFIDAEDLTTFTRQINELPRTDNYTLLGLDTIRNKMIYFNLLSYAMGKTWTTSDLCFGKNFINIDYYNNISLASNSCELYREKLIINGVSHIAIKPYFSTKIANTDTLYITSRLSKQSMHQALNKKDSIEFHYLFPL